MTRRQTAAIVAAMVLSSVDAAAQPDTVCSVSAAQFAALQTGMSFKQATDIIGCSGDLLSENEIGTMYTSMYAWRGTGTIGANMSAMFQNGRLVMKSQYGLR